MGVAGFILESISIGVSGPLLAGPRGLIKSGGPPGVRTEPGPPLGVLGAAPHPMGVTGPPGVRTDPGPGLG